MSIESREISAEEARTFRHFSVHNAAQAQQTCPEGTCQAYRDIFTYRRWRAQGCSAPKVARRGRVTGGRAAASLRVMVSAWSGGTGH